MCLQHSRSSIIERLRAHLTCIYLANTSQNQATEMFRHAGTYRNAYVPNSCVFDHVDGLQCAEAEGSGGAGQQGFAGAAEEHEYALQFTPSVPPAAA